jgi:hypothetical protein
VSAELVDVALARLTERSLLAVSIDGKTVIVQRLVVHMVRDQLSRRGRLVAACRAAASVPDIRAAALAGTPDRSAIRDTLAQVAALQENMAGSVAEGDDELARTPRRRDRTEQPCVPLRGGGPEQAAVARPETSGPGRG